jgi:cyclophilin family peptidyl-prolyl cis-trans isomerase/HEAT repeat protein
LRLEDQRMLRDPAPSAEEAPVIALPPPHRGESAPVSPPPRARPDLVDLLRDPEARIRRRAALALGRVGLAEAVAPLVARLQNDPEAEVRQMAAFAIGLIGDASAAEPLTRALKDPSPVVQGRAAEALGLAGATSAAAAIGEMVRAHVTSALNVVPDDLSHPLAPEVEAFRLGLFALARLKAFDALAAAVLEEKGQPILWWWPVAYALQRVEDQRALTALMTLAGVDGSIGVAFAAQGLGALGHSAAIDVLARLLDPSRRDARVVVAAIRALGRIKDERAGVALLRFVTTKDLDRTLRLAAIDALGTHRPQGLTEVLIELLTHPWPPLRGAVLRLLARSDPDTFVLVLSSLDPDGDWRVRAAHAEALAFVDVELARHQLTRMLKDTDARVLPRVLTTLTHIDKTRSVPVLLEHLKHADVVVRKTAATLIGELRPDGGAAALVTSYENGLSDPTYLARAAALEGLAALGGEAARGTLQAALADPEWAVRVRAAALLRTLGPGGDPSAAAAQAAPGADYQSAIRPAPTRRPASYTAAELVHPTVSPHAYIETEKGTIEIELAVLDAPQNVLNFTALARKGFYSGLTFHRVVPNFVAQGGDPRGDGEGGPGYTLRDELSERPYMRGTVGIALDWEDTGGSQFFITHSPQPHLDGRYTVIGHVVAGMEVVDRLEQGDAIRSVLIWDGR